MRPRFTVVLMLAVASSAQAAQLSQPSIVSALPNLASITPANAAGVLQYCRQNNLVGIAASDHVLEGLTAKRGTVASPLYAQGQAGHIVTGQRNFALDKASPFLRSEACSRVLNQAKQFKP